MQAKSRFVGMLMLCAAAASPGAQAQETKILFNSFIQPKHPFNRDVLHPWLDEVAKATQGRVAIELAPSSLAPPQQQYDAVNKGIMDAAYMFHGFLADRVKLAQLAHLPWVSTTARANSIALWRTHQKYFAKANEYKDVQLISLFVLPPAQIFSMKEPVMSLAAFKGVKWYGLPGVPAKVLEFAGAGVVAVPAVRSFEIISGGTVDGFAGYSVSDAAAFHTLQYAKSVVELPGYLSAPSFAMFVNKAKWQSMPARDRELVMKMAAEEFGKRLAALDAFEEKARAAAVAKGIKFMKAPDELVAELKRLSEPLEKAWLADAKKFGVDGQAALAYYREESKKNLQ